MFAFSDHFEKDAPTANDKMVRIPFIHGLSKPDGQCLTKVMVVWDYVLATCVFLQELKVIIYFFDGKCCWSKYQDLQTTTKNNISGG